MARTTDELVEGIIEVDSGIPLAPFISAANAIVTQCCTDLDTDYEDEQLVLIETWLTAHFYCTRDMRASEERAGPVSARYQSKVDLGFDLTHYGQMAMRLDWFGGLAALNQKIKKGMSRAPSVTWVGKTKDEL